MQILPTQQVHTWFAACHTTDVPENGGVCVKYKDEQIALFYFTRRNEWYATHEGPHFEVFNGLHRAVKHLRGHWVQQIRESGPGPGIELVVLFPAVVLQGSQRSS